MTANNHETHMQCTNCDSRIVEKYCAKCGQKRSELLPSLSGFISGAWSEMLLFDARILKTLREIVFRPGLYLTDYFSGRRRRYISPFPLYLVSFSLSYALQDTLDPSDFTFCDSDAIEASFGGLCELEKKLGPRGFENLQNVLDQYKVIEVLIPILGSFMLFFLWVKPRRKFIEHFVFLLTSITAVNVIEVFVQLGSLASPTIKDSYAEGFASDFVHTYFPIWFYYRSIRGYYGDSRLSSSLKTVFIIPLYFGVGLFLVFFTMLGASVFV